MASDFQFRDVFNQKSVAFIASQLSSVLPTFDQESFIQDIMTEMESLSFGDRVELITTTLYNHLPKNYSQAVNLLVEALGPEIEGDELKGYDGFYVLPMCTYIAKYGVEFEDEYDFSMQALYEMTKRFSAEGPIRAFIRKYPQQTFNYLNKWVEDPNPHVRRLVSEGTRPRLPLSSPLHEFIENPSAILPLLSKLREDSSLYVRRSVANNFNDISKDNPKTVINTFREWLKSSNSKETAWIMKHALRTLFKQGNFDALELLGYSPKVNYTVQNFEVHTPQVTIGDDLIFEFRLTHLGNTPQKFMIDYVIDYVKANGSLRSKTFKLANITLQPQESHLGCKSQSFRQMSTRTHYPGVHQLSLLVNGNRSDSIQFKVVNQ